MAAHSRGCRALIPPGALWHVSDRRQVRTAASTDMPGSNRRVDHVAEKGVDADPPRISCSLVRIGRKRRWRLISVRRFYPGLWPRIRDLAASTTCSGVKPSSCITISPGADAPKRFSPMIAPSRPT